MRLFPPPIFRHAARGMTGPAQRSFVTSTRRFQVQNANMSSLLAAAHRLEIAKKAQQTAKSVPLSEDDTSLNPDEHSPGTVKLMNGAHIRRGRHQLLLSAPNMNELELSYVYLRDLCKCPRCVDPHSKQRSFRLNDIPHNIKPRHIEWDGQYLEIIWNQDVEGTEEAHHSRWHYTYLENPYIDTHDFKTMTPFLWGSDRMKKKQHWINYDDFMINGNEFTIAMRNLQRFGLIFVKGIPHSREMVENIATRMGPLRNTFYGMTWDVRTVPKAKNVAYTNQFLGFHMDLMYMNEPPGYQLLHCLENSCQGGESLFADAFFAANEMKLQHRESYDILTRAHLAYEYVHKDQIYYNTRPVFELDERTGQLRHVNYSPPFQAAIPEPKRVDSDDIDYKLLSPDPKLDHSDSIYLRRALATFTKLLESTHNVFELKLNPGECVIFDNRRIVHARRQFNTTTGSRWLAGAYVDTDAVLSRFHICNKQNPKIWRHFDPSPYEPFHLDMTRSSWPSIKAASNMEHEVAQAAKRAKMCVKDELKLAHAERIAGKQKTSWNQHRENWKGRSE
ncbi:hypothetical protein N7540_008885 [Penicillium herquei]|nr:hypothetical protein N7540_008885 [Penicillium herquei]